MEMQVESWLEDIEEFETAEDFLDYFGVGYDPVLVQTKRVQLLRLYQALMQKITPPLGVEDYRTSLDLAYRQLCHGRELGFAPSHCGDCHDCE
jgi:hypothetical protein